uniref:Uncharacterized protein n=1 Tax=Arundo donax TaxID=35708 RepID=A0A0A9AGL9_ARUDO
MPVAQPETPTA